MERDNAKQLARQDIEGEKRELEKKIASLYQEIAQSNANRDTSMAQLHSRFVQFRRFKRVEYFLLIAIITTVFFFSFLELNS